MKEEKKIQHLAVIMDGNRRWARKKGMPAMAGHKAGYETLKKFGDWCLAAQIPVVTVWGFSTENWLRKKEEVDFIMKLALNALTKDLDYFVSRNLQVHILGRLEQLSPALQKSIAHVHEQTKNNTAGIFNICFNYGGQAEIVDAVQNIVASGVSAETITPELLARHMYFPDMPPPDIIVRTSGEMRHSGFLLWHSAYAEYFYVDNPWPDFSQADLHGILDDFKKRERRFGGDAHKK